MSPLLGGAAPVPGADQWCFDATTLIMFNDAKRIDLLGEWLGQAYVPEFIVKHELCKGQKATKKNQPTIKSPWLHWVPSHPDDAEKVADLVQLFGKAAPENQGEAEVIAMCERHGWSAVFEDEAARTAARERGIPHCYTVTLLALGAATMGLNPSTAWKIHQAMEESRGRFGRLKPDEAMRPVFGDLCNAYRALWLRLEKPSYPVLLGSTVGDGMTLDDVMIRLVNRARTAS